MFEVFRQNLKTKSLDIMLGDHIGSDTGELHGTDQLVTVGKQNPLLLKQDFCRRQATSEITKLYSSSLDNAEVS